MARNSLSIGVVNENVKVPECKMNAQLCGSISIILGIGCILILILVPLSFQYVEWDERAFKKDNPSSKVYTDKVYKNGRYFWGITKGVVTFPAQYIQEDITLSIASSNGQEFTIDIIFYWRARDEALESLYRQYAQTIENQVEIRAQSLIKNQAPLFSIDDYITQRAQVEDGLFQSLYTELDNLGIDMPRSTFHLKYVNIPTTIINLNLDAAIQIQTNQKRIFEQRVAQEAALTQTMVEDIKSNTTLSTQEAQNEASRIVQFAKNRAIQVNENTDSKGLSNFFNTLNITNTAVKQTYLQYFADLRLFNSTVSA